MQIRLILVLGFLVFFLAGCATQAKYEKILRDWKGRNIDEVFASWGYPESSFVDPNGNTMYMYKRSSIMTVPVQTWPGGQINPLSGQSAERWCKTYFETDKDKKIINCYYEGNACVSQ